MNMLTEEESKKIKVYEEQINEHSKYNKPAGVLAFFSIAFLLGLLFALDDVNYESFSMPFGIGFLVCVGMAIFLGYKGKQFSLNGNQLAALYAYRSYQSISDYLEYADIPSKLGKAKKELKNMKYEITNGWSSFSTNMVISSRIPQVANFVENIENFVDVIKKDTSKLEQSKETLLKLIKFFLDEKNINFELVNSDLLKYKKIVEKPLSEKKISLFKKYPILKFLWISPLSGIILFSVFHSIDPTKIHESLGYSVTASVAILLGIITLKRK